MSKPSPLDTREQEQAEKDRKEAARRAAQVESGDIRWLMNSKQGRRIMWRLLERTGIYRSSFTGSGSETFFREGERNIGLQLMALVNENCPDLYNNMVTENR